LPSGIEHPLTERSVTRHRLTERFFTCKNLLDLPECALLAER
jgi:hypothetical protein